MTPTPHLPAEDADVAEVQAGLQWAEGEDCARAEAALDRLAAKLEGQGSYMQLRDRLDATEAKLQEAERKRDYWKDCAHGWHPVDVHLRRAEAAERERDEAREDLVVLADHWKSKFDSAEAREAALRDALERLLPYAPNHLDNHARTALATTNPEATE